MQDKDKIIVELKAENAKLKQELAEIGKSWGEIQEMRNANAKLKEEFEIESLTDNTTGETFYRSNKVNKLKEELATYGATGVCEVCSDKANKLADKYLGCLQEIKAIGKNICNGCTSECDCDEDCNYFLITETLTKAEEE